MQFGLVSALLRGDWFIDTQFMEQTGAVLSAGVLKGNHVEKIEDLEAAYAVEGPIHTVRHSYYHGFDKAPQNSVAVVKLQGPLMKKNQECGPIGMARIGEIIQEADSHHNISSIVLHIDSPGGTVDGTERLAEIVAGTKKPIIAFVDGMMASAALWVGVACDEVISSNDMDIVGSVGVVHNSIDIQPYWEALGVKFHKITPPESKDKTKMYDDIRKENYEEYKKTVLSPLAQRFQQHVRDCRENVSDEHLTGKTYFAKDVMGVFVNEIGPYERAITRAAELAEEQEESNNNNSQNSASMKKLTALQGAMGVDALERETDGGISLTSDQAEAVNDKIQQSAQAAQTAGEQLTTTQQELATANDTITANAATIADHVATIATLKAASGGKTTTTVVKKDTDTEGASDQDNTLVDQQKAVESAQELMDLV